MDDGEDWQGMKRYREEIEVTFYWKVPRVYSVRIHSGATSNGMEWITSTTIALIHFNVCEFFLCVISPSVDFYYYQLSMDACCALIAVPPSLSIDLNRLDNCLIRSFLFLLIMNSHLWMASIRWDRSSRYVHLYSVIRFLAASRMYQSQPIIFRLFDFIASLWFAHIFISYIYT